MADWVWAIDEDGKPCKCTAKPENRGKRNCKHRFHAAPGESQKDFFKKYGIGNPQQAFTTENNVEVPDITSEDLPDYTDMINNIVTITDDSSREEFSESINRIISHNRFARGGHLFDGTDVSVTSEQVDEDGNNTIITMRFKDDSGEYERQFEIPRMNDQGEYIINGTAYRYIPSIEKSKRGINVLENRIFIKNEYEESVINAERNGSDECAIRTESNGKFNWEKATLTDVDNYLSGRDSSLTQEQKDTLSHLSPVAIERYNSIGMDGIRNIKPDDINDLEYRGVTTYRDRVAYTISKNLLSMNNHMQKARKSGREYMYPMDNMSTNIKKDLVGASYMQIADDINPIAAMSQSQRVSWVSEGNWTSINVPDSVRRTHPSYYGMTDPADVSLGGKVGLTVAVRGHISKNGYLVKDDNAMSGSDFIPFVEHCDPNRASMAISQMREACPIIGGEDPKASTRGWDSIKGSKLGLNLNTAYIPEKGVWEDAVVISESTAKKMATVQSRKYAIKDMPKSVKVGQTVERGERVGGVEISYPGKIKSISDGHIEVESVYTMSVGDKVAGRSGNKGVVSRIVPDKDMPKVNGRPADIIMSPIGVAGRSNLGQIYEVNNGDFNKKSRIEYNGHTVEGTGGEQFVMRLNQIAEKKMLSNADKMTNDKEYKSRWGEMEQILLSSNENRLDILNYVKHQEYSDVDHKLNATLHSIGVDIRPVDDDE